MDFDLTTDASSSVTIIFFSSSIDQRRLGRYNIDAVHQYIASVLYRYSTDTTIFVIFNVYVIVFETITSSPSWIPTAFRQGKRRLSNAIRDVSRHHQAVIVINSDLPENTAVAIGPILRQLKAVTELLWPNNLPFLLQANAFAFTSLSSAFPAARRGRRNFVVLKGSITGKAYIRKSIPAQRLKYIDSLDSNLSFTVYTLFAFFSVTSSSDDNTRHSTRNRY
ncbi:hypothetical protein AAVH_00806 [Aphelenchoides avenae]|nr:hypothetical protein AAVH_00806 [Aphelenchus avenae]